MFIAKATPISPSPREERAGRGADSLQPGRDIALRCPRPAGLKERGGTAAPNFPAPAGRHICSRAIILIISQAPLEAASSALGQFPRANLRPCRVY